VLLPKLNLSSICNIKVSASSVAGQMLAMTTALMAALFSVLMLMLLEEKLLTQTVMDEIVLLAIWVAWAGEELLASCLLAAGMRC
jgi:hypothetical protein